MAQAYIRPNPVWPTSPVDTEEDGLQLIRKLINFLQNNLEETPLIECKGRSTVWMTNLNDIIPDNPNQAYDMYEVIGTIIDNGEFLEVHADYAKNIIVGFARFNEPDCRHRSQPAENNGRLSGQQRLPQGRSFRPFL